MSGRENLVLGLELADLLALQGALVILMIFSVSLFVALPALLGLYFSIRVFKKSKPPFYTERLVRFLMRPTRFNLLPEDTGEVRDS